ncbi:hypothetical protein, partial [Corallococcus sp. 4LFB]|uniref:hypothetical protein n=1 Tax=Corallococcus sp. 4LFB TaxID=3383249 RepID=UPI00397624E2
MRIPPKPSPPSRTSAPGSTVAATVLTLASGVSAGRLPSNVSDFQPQAPPSRTGNTLAVNTAVPQRARAPGLDARA